MGQINPVYGSIVPSLQQQILNSNYLNFANGGGNDFAQQYLPEVYEAEVERYGNRTLSGFLRMVGAEMPMTSDQVIWSEQNRLHISYTGCSVTSAAGAAIGIISIPSTASVSPVTGAGQTAPIQTIGVINLNDTVVIMNTATGVTVKAVVVVAPVVAAGGAPATQIQVTSFTAANLNALGAAANLKIFVYGSVFAKGTFGSVAAAQPQFTQFNNQPIIIKDRYQINGSDTAQIGWVEVATEDGTGGYLWYLKAESETRLRFEDYLEMSVVEGELAAAGSGALAAGKKGTEGFFAAVKSRGNVNAGFDAATGLAGFDAILQNLDTQGAIEENMLFLNRGTNLAFDDMLAGVGSGAAVYSGGSSFGVFENSEDMALNLGFSGFRRGSYDFYKTDWKYLNDASTRGGAQPLTSSQVGDIQGVLVPAGTSTVYDQVLGTNIRRPFLHVRYRASQADDRRMKNWITGSVGGAYTSDLDAMEVHFLSERCLCVQGANNFVLFTV